MGALWLGHGGQDQGSGGRSRATYSTGISNLWSTPHGTRPGGEPGNLLSARYLEKPFAMPVPRNGGPPNYAADRNAIALYEFPGQRVVTHFITEMPLRVSSTRGLGAYANVFAIESFIDELAKRGGGGSARVSAAIPEGPARP